MRLLEPPFPRHWMIPDRSSPSRVRCAASRPGRLRADPGDVAVYEGKGMDGLGCRVFPGRACRAEGLNLSVSYQPPEQRRVYCGAELRTAWAKPSRRAPIWFLTRSPGGYPAMSKKMTLLRPSSTSASLHKRVVSQRPDSELVFKGLGVAKRYCRRDSIGDSFLQRRPRAGHPGAAPGRDAPPPQPRPGWKAQLR